MIEALKAIGLPEQLPDGWRAQPIKQLYEVELGKMLQSEASSPSDIRRPYLRAANVTTSGVDVRDVREMWFSLGDWQRVQLSAGDLLISEGGDVGRPAIWHGELSECGIQNALNRARPSGPLSNQYLLYVLTSLRAQGAIAVVCNKATIPHYTAEKVGATRIPVPPRDVAEAIVTYLDSETARIDALIDRKRRFIDLLLEKRSALVTHAVTQGANPEARTKSSPLEWFAPAVPSHWQKRRLKHLLCERVELVEDGRLSELLSVFAAVGIRPRAEMPDVGNKAVTSEGYKQVRAGDLVVNKMLAWMGALGLSDYDGVTSPAYSVYSVSPSASGEYLHLLLRTDLYQSEFRRRASGIMPMRWTVVPSVFLDTPAILPPVEEQLATVAWLRAQTAQLDGLASMTRTSVDLLREYRAALISAAVSGQIDIPGIDASEAAS